jgi:hypothetical protein
MKAILRLFMAISLLLAATGANAFFGNNNDWGGYGGNWNPYDEWDPRYWMEEMENEWDDDDDYYRGGRGYGGYGPYGGGPGYGGYGPGNNSTHQHHNNSTHQHHNNSTHQHHNNSTHQHHGNLSSVV